MHSAMVPRSPVGFQHVNMIAKLEVDLDYLLESLEPPARLCLISLVMLNRRCT